MAFDRPSSAVARQAAAGSADTRLHTSRSAPLRAMAPRVWRMRVGVTAAAMCALVALLAAPQEAAAGCLGPKCNCNGHGHCKVDGSQFNCECYPGWEGISCQRAQCPKGKAWAGTADTSGNGHFLAPCSNAGQCDVKRGVCRCYRGYTGLACERLECPKSQGVECSGHGICYTMADLNLRWNKTDENSAYEYSLWDYDQTTACECDKGWTGYDCAEQQCPFGDDPLSYGTREVQTVRTSGTHRDEIQRLVLTTTANTDTDEIQSYGWSDGDTGVIPLTGFYTLTFTTTTTTCTVCGVIASETTSKLSVDADASVVEAALEALSNIDDVTVSRALTGATEGYTYRVTFVGTNVGGNVPLLTMSPTTYGDSVSTTYPYTVTSGTGISGSVSFTFVDTNSNPAGAVGSVSSTSINVGSTAATVASTLTQMSNVGAVTVTRTVNGGPSVTFDITFTEDLGDVDELACSISAGNTCTPSTTQAGWFLTGTFTITVGAWGTTSALAADASTSTVHSAITALDTTSTMGDMEVTRSQYIPTAGEWTGGYTWTITFVHQVDNVADLGATSTLGGAGGTETVAVGTQSSQLAGIETDAANVQVNEVQLIECTCAGTCSGSTKFKFRGKTSAAIAYGATAATIKSTLEDMATIDGVTVTQYGGSVMCDSDGVSTLITFTHNAGNLPQLITTSFSISGTTSSSFRVYDGSGILGANGGITRTGSREWVECNNRGQCDRSTGTCKCYTGFVSGNGAALDVASSAGNRHDCGHNSVALTACSASVSPNGLGNGEYGACSNRGTCSGSPQYVCTCNSGYSGGACEFTDCPTALAWADYATATDTAHAASACSGRGKCNAEVGTCECDRNYLMDPLKCSKLNCPDDDCADHGTCLVASTLANLTKDSDGNLAGAYYEGWDSSKIHGCSCNRVYTGAHEWDYSTWVGAACNDYLSCPTGDDPHTNTQVSEVQSIFCSMTSGTFTVSFRGSTTGAISYSASLTGVGAGFLESELEKLDTIRNVTITTNGTDTTVCTSAGTTLFVEFVTETGDPPLMVLNTGSMAGGTMTIHEFTKGTREDVECSNRGVCDGSTGKCKCAEGYGSSDGQNNQGRLGECGRIHAFEGSEGKFALYK